jgi:uncharacterized protein YcbX
VNVVTLSTSPIKGTRLHVVDELELSRDGAHGDRRFFVVDARDRMINAKSAGELQSVVAECQNGTLALSFPGGERVEAPIAVDDEVRVRFFSRTVSARPLGGPFSEALSEHLGQPVRVVESAAGAVDRGRSGGASLISRASLERLAEAADENGIDARRFRMLIEIDGIAAHEEDAWVGHRVRVGEATIRFRGHVGRCLITSRGPESGVIDLPTLDILGAYRRDAESTEPLPFGIYGEVVEPGKVQVGDPVQLIQ